MYKLSLFVIIITLVTTGAGCQLFQAADQVSGELINGAIGTPLQTLEKAQQLAEQQRLAANWQNDLTANEMTVGLVVLENTTDPKIGATNPEIIGCNDRIALVPVPREADSGHPLQDALTSLFAIRETSWKGYHNALASSTLSVEKIQSRDGVTTEVWLTGELKSAGTCDDPRLKAQIETTIQRLKPKFQIYLNGTAANYRCFGDMSGQCQ